MSQLFFFNPTCEMAIANGQVSYMPPHHLQIFEKDLAELPWILGTEDDYVLVKDVNYNSLNHLAWLGWKTPTPVKSPAQLPMSQKNALSFTPWGWSPALINSFKPFIESGFSNHSQLPFSPWTKSFSLLFSKETGCHLLAKMREIYLKNPGNYPLLYVPPIPKKISTFQQLENIMEEYPPPSIIKTPWGASGKGLYRIRNHKDNPVNSQWVKGMLKKQGWLYIEKLLYKIQDVSFQFMIGENEIKYLGHNFFYTEPSGQFAGCDIGGPVNSSPLFSDRGKVTESITQASGLVKEAINEIQLGKKYRGPAGVDGLFFMDKDGILKLQPCLEINLRYNMGMANIILKNKIHTQAKGIWKTGIFREQSWEEFCTTMTKKKPAQMEQGKIKSGFLPLVNPAAPKTFGAWLLLE